MSNIISRIPKTTSPLTKFIRTTEGWLVVVFNGAMLIVPIVSNFPAVQAAKWAGIVNAAVVISRSGLKGLALFATTTGMTPIAPGSVPPELSGLPDDNTSDPTASMSDKPQSGVKPDVGTPVGEPSSDVLNTGPSPGADVPGATARRPRQ